MPVEGDSKKKILLVAYHFPPSNAVGGLRIAKFARYLPSFGWIPTVLTVEDRYREQLDNTRLKDLGDVRVVKTVPLPRVTDFLLSLKRMASSLIRGKASGGVAFEDHYGENVGTISEETLLQRMKRYYIAFSSIPDSERSWVIPAAWHAIREIRRGGIDCIMTSSPPHSSHLIGLIASKITRIRWVADFRDPWIDILPNRTPRIRCALSDRIETWLERLVIEHADTIITTTDEHRRSIISRFPAAPLEKFVYIPNGIDSEKFSTSSLPRRYEQFTLAYAGSIYLKRTPEPIFKALHALVSSGRVQPSEIRFKLFGECESVDGKPICQLIQAYGLESIVEVSKSVPFVDAINVMQRSHLLVLLATPVQDINIPAKIYDYFGSETKIMAITEPGATSSLIESTNSGACFNPSDCDGIADYIYSLLRREDRDQVRNNPSSYAHFDTRLLTGKLAQQISSLSGLSA